MEAGSKPTAGWYPDPRETFEERWWDGAAWTERVREHGKIGLSPSDATPADDQDLLAVLREMAATSAGRTSLAGTWQPDTTPPAGTDSPPPSPPPGYVAAPATASSVIWSPPRIAATTDWPFWWLVGLPAVGAFGGLVMDQTGAGGLVGIPVLLVAFTGTIWLALLDLRLNPEILHRATQGKGSLVTLAALFAPGYLWVRQRVLGRSGWPAAAYLVIALLALALIPEPPAGTMVNARWLESEIQQSAAETPGTSIQVDCPDGEPMRTGHRFTCTVLSGGQRMIVRVEVIDDAGYVRWETVG